MPMKKNTRKIIRRIAQVVLTSNPLTRSTYNAIQAAKSANKRRAAVVYSQNNPELKATAYRRYNKPKMKATSYKKFK